MKARCLLLSLGLMSAIVTEASADKAKVVTYVVQEGDTCERVAQKVYGNRKLAKLLHMYNYFPSSTHELKIGQKLLVIQEMPEAKLTGFSGEVMARPPTSDEWQPARQEMGFSRAWQVMTSALSGAEITMNDGALLRLGEGTTAAIHGLGDLALLLRSPQAELLGGSCKTILKDGQQLSVRTSTAKLKLSEGSARLKVAADGATIVMNDEGSDVKVSGRSEGDQDAPLSIALRAGMGTRIKRGEAPGEPQPLPEAPEWSGINVSSALATAHTGDLRVSWGAVLGVEGYVIEVSRDAEGAEVSQRTTVAGGVTAFTFTGLPVGVYYASVTSIDAASLESRPSTRLVLEVIEPAFRDPEGAPVTSNRLSVGSHFQAPEGYRCTKEALETPKTMLSFEQAGRFTLRCADELGITLNPLEIEVHAVRVSVAEASPGQAALLRRGQPTQMSFAFSGAVASSLRLQQDIYAEFTPLQRQEDGTWQTTITLKEPSPPRLAVRFLSGAEKAPLLLGEVLLPIEPQPFTPQTPEAPAPTPPARLKIGVGLVGGASLNKAAALDGLVPSPVFLGLRIGLDAAFTAVEAEVKSSLPLNGAPTELNAGAHLKLSFAPQGFYPFVLAGVGLELTGSAEAKAFFYPGFGVEYRGQRGLGLRLDLRGVFMPHGAPENLYGESSLGLFLRR